MSTTIVLLILALLQPVPADPSRPGAGHGSSSSPTLHFRYLPQRTATYLDEETGNKPRHIRIGPLTTKMEDDYAREIAVNPNGRFLYECVGSFAYVAQSRIGSHGVVSDLKPLKVDAHSHPASISFHPSGRFAYVSCSHGAICQYRVLRSGQLKPLSPPQVYGSNDPSPLRFASSGRLACVVSDGQEDSGQIVTIYRISAEGKLTLLREIHVKVEIPYSTLEIVVRGNRVSTNTIARK